MTAKEIRKAFLDFFASKNHHIVPSAPMVVKGDPTLMFTNAGMNQFKDIILGNTEPQYRRVSDSQKCLRVSGKHNDLEEVGHDTYHHTMFEMLGNWSFGDYFKKEAISWAFEFLHDVLKINSDRLYATVFEGDDSLGIARDEEAAQEWEKYLPKESILNGNKKDNFWEMGEVGPCGPCSEIHIDLRSEEERKEIAGRDLVNKDHPQVVEIWNLVFMQYNHLANGTLEPLPKKVIDTGMGFERLCMVMQGKNSTYDTDLFTPMLSAIGTLANVSYGQDPKKDVAMRVVADHIRTIAFAIADGQLPSNAKAGYVIRRILRRAVRYAYTFLNLKEPFMYSLLPTLINIMGDAYPELEAQKELITKVMKQEEEGFLRTLAAGIHLLDKMIANLGDKQELPGKDAFELYDTYGFPSDLTELILRENGKSMDSEKFNEEMAKQKERARSATALQTGDWIEINEGEPIFVGYDQESCSTNILRCRKVVQKGKEYYQVVLSYTPLYAEMGGQVGDKGQLIAPDGTSYFIFDTQRENNLAIHCLKELPEDLENTFTISYDKDLRQRAESNHTATHLLHQALREILGKHVEQKGSYVSPQVLRFDFSHYDKLSPEQIRAVEMRVSEMIRSDFPLEECREMPIEEARAAGAMALFGEKYGDKVRVVRFGPSLELCGGTHLASTGHIGSFRIISESSIAAGVRRIEAVAGKNAEEYLYKQEDLLNSLKDHLGNPQDPEKALAKLNNEYEALKEEIKQMEQKETSIMKKELLENPLKSGDCLIFLLRGEIKPEIVKDIAFQLKGEVSDPFAFVAGTTQGIRSMISILLSDQLVQKGLHAGNMVRDVAKLIRGGGGGQPYYATAGGKGSDGLEEALQEVVAKLKQA